MTWELFTSGSAIVKAGTNVNSTIKASGSALAGWYDEILGIMVDTARVDLSGSYANLNMPGKFIIQNIGSSFIAQKMVMYHPSSYSSKAESNAIINVLENDIVRGLALIKDDKVKTYLGAT